MDDMLRQLFPAITDNQVMQLQQYATLLARGNRKVNLISRKDTSAIWEHHLLPSILPLKILHLPHGHWVVDTGSGGGLPAIPLKVLRPDLQLLMVDSVRKKVIFLRMVIRELGLANTSAIAERVESLHDQPEFYEKFDLLTARALGSIDLLIRLGSPLLRSPKQFYLWKGESDILELEASAHQLGFQYQIDSLPEKLHHFSPKLAALRWFSFTLK